MSKLTVTGFFRGQIFSVETPVELHPVAGLVAIGPAPADPPDAGVAVKANADIIKKFGQGTGSIAIVLDCSGSMRFNNDKEKTKNEKLTNAKTAITRVLKDVPPGTTVSLWTFSQLPPELATDKDDNALFRSDDPKYQQLQAEPELTIQRLRNPLRWDINQINSLATKLDELRPWFETPLVEAMVKAARTDLVNAKGMRTLLVLTDGDETQFPNSKALGAEMRGSPDIASFVAKVFQPLGITVNMVFLCNNDKDPELKRARANFAKSLENLIPPGTFVSATDTQQLNRSLRRALRQKLLYDIVKPGGTVLQHELDVSGEQQTDPLNWSGGLSPGTYQLRVHADSTYERRVELKRGDRLIVQLFDDKNGKIGFERGIYGDEPDFRSSPQQKQNDWRLAALANQTVGEGPTSRLLLLTSLEPTTSPNDGPVRQVRPRLTWFDLSVDGNQSPGAYAVRWHERIKYAAPAWLLEVPRWLADRAAGGPAKPILRHLLGRAQRHAPFARRDVRQHHRVPEQSSQVVPK